MLNLGTFTLPRLNAHRMVLAAAALTTLVAAALTTTLVVFSDQALPHTVKQRLTAASGTSMLVTGPIANTNAAGYTAALRADMTAALAGVPSAFYYAYWSDPLGLPVKSGKVVPIAEAAAFERRRLARAPTGRDLAGRAGTGRADTRGTARIRRRLAACLAG